MVNQMNETMRRIDKAISSYSASLMNNTKWREVLEVIAEVQIPIQFAFVRDEKFLSAQIFPKNICKEYHTSDCTSHGPFYFKEIFAIKCPRFDTKRDQKTGRHYDDETRFNELLSALSKLGQLPLEVKDDCLILHGYRK